MISKPMRSLALTAGLLVLPVTANAEDPAVENGQIEDGRYTLERQGKRFVRLDTQTGQMSVCRLKAEELVCRLAVDERNAYLDEIATLQNRLDRAERANGEKKGDRLAKQRHFDDEEHNDDIHDDDHALEKEFDRALDYSAKALRRFFDVMRELRDDYNREL
jgi:hypothetical protein